MSAQPANVTVTVSILGRDYQVSCPADERSALERAARHLDDQMREIRNSGKIVGSERIAVMVALNMSHELLSQRGALEHTQDEARHDVQRLCERIDSVLGEVRAQRSA